MTSKNALKTKGGDDQMKSAELDKDETPTTELDPDNDAQTTSSHVRPSL